MNPPYKISLFIFRRDLRIPDNTGLIKALENSETVFACFILNPEQVGPINTFKSSHALQFMAESLKELGESFKTKGAKLYLFTGTPLSVLTQLIHNQKIDAIFVNKDYTPYSTKRDEEIKEFCREKGIDFISCSDVLLIEPEEGTNDQGKPYKIFTPFFNKNRHHQIAEPHLSYKTSFGVQPFPHEINFNELEKYLLTSSSQRGGRQEGMRLLSKLYTLTNYKKSHDFPSQPTSGLSPHLKFGTLSIRECYHAIQSSLGIEHPLIRQLFWRDFFYHIAYFYPYVFGHPFYSKFESLAWSDDEASFKKWSDGVTGFPLIDAGMRQLKQTGFLHNRIRLVVASFLVKDLHINWLWGEKYFAQQLTDYDPAVNNGNWQWVASTGSDHQPYFQIFNPWLQQKKFDLECDYIKQWVPELKHVEPKVIHSWYTIKTSHAEYPRPMRDHEQESAWTRKSYKHIFDFRGT
jgi:deoxyribodipyrimidine photo-lyase